MRLALWNLAMVTAYPTPNVHAMMSLQILGIRSVIYIGSLVLNLAREY